MKPLTCLNMAAVMMMVATGFASADEKREAKPRIKGVELYSWKDKEGDWSFVLLDGTNRIKSEAEVKGAKNRLTSPDDLTKELSRLAVGETVIWTHRIAGFEFPSKATREKIEKAAKEAKIDLHSSRKE